MYLISLYFDNDNTMILNNYIKCVQEKTKNDYMMVKNIPPHLTIATIHDQDKNIVINKLNDIVQHFNEDYLDVVSIGTFAKNTIYLMPIYNQYLHNLSTQINDCMNQIDFNRQNNRYQPFHWLPHITIARKLNDKQLSLAFDCLSHLFIPLHVKVTHIALSKSHPYQDIYIWKLKGKKK